MPTSTGTFRQRAWWGPISVAALGALSGFVNGLLGTGGGILLVYLLSPLVTKSGFVTEGPGKRDVYANALAVMLPISIFSAFRYAAAGQLDMVGFSPLILPSLAGGVVGGVLLDRLRLPLLQRLFAALVLVSGVMMVLRG